MKTNDLRSICSNEESYLTVINETSEEVDLLWLNFEGAEVSYGKVAPGRLFSVSSLVTHPWIVRGTETCRTVCTLIVAPGGQSIAVKDPAVGSC